MEFNEEKFKAYVKPHILRCRGGDWRHAERVVEWVKELGKNREDLNLLIAAAYIHDIGWRDVLPSQKLSLEELKTYEEEANKNSETYAAEILTKLDYPLKEIKTIIRLIKAADSYQSIKEEEAIIVDADNLSKLNIDHLKEKYKKDEWVRMYDFWKERFPDRIRTKEGNSIFPKLLENLKEDIFKETNKKF